MEIVTAVIMAVQKSVESDAVVNVTLDRRWYKNDTNNI